MYQMGPKSPSVNGSGKPQVVSDAQAREKLAVSCEKNLRNPLTKGKNYDVIFLGIRL